ncbi:hypothetical protein [Dyella acidisoli]|uniref:Uncharacterized protein n=1 Tax=Dyella acidisoli TaxID=1867834 RepID=A0ABQ5XT16_9GAMM|nr:hypothetical protein [Dyella acidisoli]GLQ94852.1 hypothetical protein GCM10007901_38050 [Dyella acidisoli]
MGSKIIAAAWLVFGLALSSQAVAQDASKSITSFQNLTSTPGLSTTAAHMSNVRVANQAQINDWKSSPPILGSSDQFTNPSNIHLSLTPVSNTQALRRLPFYVTAPYWLPRSRPFNASNDISTAQHTTHGALINDVAALVRSSN